MVRLRLDERVPSAISKSDHIYGNNEKIFCELQSTKPDVIGYILRYATLRRPLQVTRPFSVQVMEGFTLLMLYLESSVDYWQLSGYEGKCLHHYYGTEFEDHCHLTTSVMVVVMGWGDEQEVVKLNGHIQSFLSSCSS